jgi:hypothetical protein
MSVLNFLHNTRDISYIAVHRFGQAKFAESGLILGSSQFTQLLQQPLKTTLNLKKVKINFKIIILLYESKSMTRSVANVFYIRWRYLATPLTVFLGNLTFVDTPGTCSLPPGKHCFRRSVKN